MCQPQKWSVEGDQSDVHIISTSCTHSDVRSWFLFLIIYNHKTNHQEAPIYVEHRCSAIRFTWRILSIPWHERNKHYFHLLKKWENEKMKTHSLFSLDQQKVTSLGDVHTSIFYIAWVAIEGCIVSWCGSLLNISFFGGDRYSSKFSGLHTNQLSKLPTSVK